jgi:hypothetical protein
MRKVQCVVTGEKGAPDDFYRAPNNKWYKSKEVYLKWKQNDDLRRQAINYFCVEFLNYQPGCIFPTLLARRVKEYESGYGYAVLIQCMKEQHDRIQLALSRKVFESDYHRMNYTFAIINQHINETYHHQKQSKKATAPTAVPEEMHNLETKHTERDVRRWLDDT